MSTLLSFFLRLCVTSCSATFVLEVFYFDHSCSQHCQFSETVSHIDSFLGQLKSGVGHEEIVLSTND